MYIKIRSKSITLSRVIFREHLRGGMGILSATVIWLEKYEKKRRKEGGNVQGKGRRRKKERKIECKMSNMCKTRENTGWVGKQKGKIITQLQTTDFTEST